MSDIRLTERADGGTDVWKGTRFVGMISTREGRFSGLVSGIPGDQGTAVGSSLRTVAEDMVARMELAEGRPSFDESVEELERRRAGVVIQRVSPHVLTSQLSEDALRAAFGAIPRPLVGRRLGNLRLWRARLNPGSAWAYGSSPGEALGKTLKAADGKDDGRADGEADGPQKGGTR